jgi:hypothetical protein
MLQKCFPILIITCAAAIAFAEDSLKISKIYIHSKDAFEDAIIRTPVERELYRFGNLFHINTRESVIRERLPFGEDSIVTQRDIQETEKNLRSLPYISDAKIETKLDSLGNTDLYVETSDNWTFSPQFNIGKPNEEWLWAIGLMESNLLGLGHTIGIFYEHAEDRDQTYLLYKSDDFLFPYHSFNFFWSENTDGFSRSLGFGYPFITRSKNQWSYNAEMLWSKRDENYYESRNKDPISTVRGFKEDSLSTWLSRSFGGSSFKTYLGAGYDFHRIENGELRMENKELQKDSRVGFSLAASRIHLDKRHNLYKVKWTEDVERGYYIKSTVTKNFRDLNAASDDWYFEQKINLSLGASEHNFLARGENTFYHDEKNIRDMHSMLFGEYIFKPGLDWSSVLSGQVNSWQKNSFMRQLYLDGNNIFPGFPAYYLAGENTFAFKAEQRYFPKFEIFTLIPHFAVFLTAGQATENLHDFEPRDLLYMAGFGLRVSKSKFVQAVVNHVNLSWSLNDELKKSFVPRLSFVGKYEL